MAESKLRRGPKYPLLLRLPCATDLGEVQVDLVAVKVGVEGRAVGVVKANGALKRGRAESGRGGEETGRGKGARSEERDPREGQVAQLA